MIHKQAVSISSSAFYRIILIFVFDRVYLYSVGVVILRRWQIRWTAFRSPRLLVVSTVVICLH